jgi:hypothetical protein
MPNGVLYVVHCIDTEGPLDESLEATFDRLRNIFGIDLEPTAENLAKIQAKELSFGGLEDAVAQCFSPELLSYNRSWSEIENMLAEVTSNEFRNRISDSLGSGWKYSWHCMDHVGFVDNPRKKALGFGEVFRFYRNKLGTSNYLNDEINWHFHPISLTRKSTHAASSFVNSYAILHEILARRIIDERWFPTVNRPGFHTERPDSHLFLEQWIPFDYANQSYDAEENQPDLAQGRFGDWRRAPKTWRGYNPSFKDYQIPGGCNRTIFRCLNLGTRTRTLTLSHVREAFQESSDYGSAILAFADHDWRNIKNDVLTAQEYLKTVSSDYPNIEIRYSGAEQAAKSLLGLEKIKEPKLKMEIIGNLLNVYLIEGELFSSQPFLALKDKAGVYHHDNLDIVQPNRIWSYIFDEQTLMLSDLAIIGVGAAGIAGGYSTDVVDLTS